MIRYSPHERAAHDALDEHQRKVREHRAASVRVEQLAVSLAEAEQDHSIARIDREKTKDQLVGLVDVL
jgi:outer membrane protein TolC